MVMPRLADVSCSKIHFDPGDRVLVKVHERLDRESKIRLRKTIERWAGTGIEVLIVELPVMDVEILRRG